MPRGRPWASQPANDAWEALLSAHATLMKQFAAEDIWSEVSMREYDVLYTLSKCPEPQRISELNRHVLLSQPALSRLVDRLAERGLVHRQRRPGRRARRPPVAHRRRPGRAAPDRRRHARGVARAMTAGLTAADLAQLETICRKLARRQRRRVRSRSRERTERFRLVVVSAAPAILPRRGCWPAAPPTAPRPWRPGTATR